MLPERLDGIEQIEDMVHDAGLEPQSIVNIYYGKKSENAIVFCYQNNIVLVT